MSSKVGMAKRAYKFRAPTAAVAASARAPGEAPSRSSTSHLHLLDGWNVEADCRLRELLIGDTAPLAHVSAIRLTGTDSATSSALTPYSKPHARNASSSSSDTLLGSSHSTVAPACGTDCATTSQVMLHATDNASAASNATAANSGAAGTPPAKASRSVLASAATAGVGIAEANPAAPGGGVSTTSPSIPAYSAAFAQAKWLTPVTKTAAASKRGKAGASSYAAPRRGGSSATLLVDTLTSESPAVAPRMLHYGAPFPVPPATSHQQREAATAGMVASPFAAMLAHAPQAGVALQVTTTTTTLPQPVGDALSGFKRGRTADYSSGAGGDHYDASTGLQRYESRRAAEYHCDASTGLQRYESRPSYVYSSGASSATSAGSTAKRSRPITDTVTVAEAVLPTVPQVAVTGFPNPPVVLQRGDGAVVPTLPLEVRCISEDPLALREREESRVPTPSSVQTRVPTPTSVQTRVPTPTSVLTRVPTPTSVQTRVPTPIAVRVRQYATRAPTSTSARVLQYVVAGESALMSEYEARDYTAAIATTLPTSFLPMVGPTSALMQFDDYCDTPASGSGAHSEHVASLAAAKASPFNLALQLDCEWDHTAITALASPRSSWSLSLEGLTLEECSGYKSIDTTLHHEEHRDEGSCNGDQTEAAAASVSQASVSVHYAPPTRRYGKLTARSAVGSHMEASLYSDPSPLNDVEVVKYTALSDFYQGSEQLLGMGYGMLRQIPMDEDDDSECQPATSIYTSANVLRLTTGRTAVSASSFAEGKRA